MSQTRVHTPRTAPVHLIFPLRIENCSLHLTILPVHVQKWMSCRCMSSFLLLLLMLCSWRRTDSACTPTHTCTVIQLCNNNIVRAYLQDKYRPALMSRHKLIYKHVPKENSAVWDIFQEINKRPLYICIYKIFMCDKNQQVNQSLYFLSYHWLPALSSHTSLLLVVSMWRNVSHSISSGTQLFRGSLLFTCVCPSP